MAIAERFVGEETANKIVQIEEWIVQNKIKNNGMTECY